MKAGGIQLGVLLFALIILSVSCAEDDPESLLVWDLEGVWAVRVPLFTGAVIDSYDITIEQACRSVELVREGKTISTGSISADTVHCTDWGMYGIRAIYIDSATLMHSEMPANESLNPLSFIKK